jgi:CMP-2-keto-3-deoxyoctulosonic acid synthetase
MCGNLAEWLSNWDAARPGAAHIGGYHYACIFCQVGLDCRPCDLEDPNDVDQLKILSDCNLQQGHAYESFPRDNQYAFIGTRCCLDGP